MNALAAQQQALQAAVTGAAGGGALLQPGSRLDVYAHAYRARLIAALKDNHEVLYRAMGDEAFHALATAYLLAHPSPHRSIRWFGDRLADYMADAWADELPHPALTDFARMDWALRGAFDAAEAPPLQPQALAALAPEEWLELRLHLQPSAALLPLAWAVESAWAALRAAESDTDLPELDEPQALQHQLLIWRQQLDTRWRSLEPLEAALLQAVQAGASFGALCEQAAAELGDEERAAPAVVACLQQWLADGLLAG